MFEFFWSLDLIPLFALVFALMLLLAAGVQLAVRAAVSVSGSDARQPVPMKDALITVTSAIFALTLAFSAAGVWSDTLQARSAVQREANALENAMSLAAALNDDQRDKVRASIVQYAQAVIAKDWPAMTHGAELGSPVYKTSDSLLVQLTDYLAGEVKSGASESAVTPLIEQLFEARNARISRLTVAAAGVTRAQWWALIAMAVCAMTAISLAHNHHVAVQSLAVGLVRFAAGSSFFIILAHDRPFIGALAVGTGPLQSLTSG